MNESRKKAWRDAGITVTDFEGADREDALFWMSLTPEQRWMELEKLRQLIYGYDPATARLQRSFKVLKRPRR